jgi:hypothetical protein
MGKEGRIIRTTLEEAKARIARGEGRINWARVDALTEEELEASIDYEEDGYPIPGTTRKAGNAAGHSPEGTSLQ